MRYIFSLLFIFCLLGCDESEVNPDTINRGLEFFPIELNTFREYQVDEKEYTFAGEVIDRDYFIREEITDAFLTGQDSTFIVYRFQRSDASEEWEPLDTRQIRRNAFQAIEIEGNTPFLKLSFPIEAGKNWDGNVLNSLDEDEYVMDSLFASFTTNDKQFDNTLTVVQQDNQDFVVELEKRIEVYAQDIGMVYREQLNLTYCTNDACLGQQIIEEGIDYKQVLVEYGDI